MDLEVEAGGLFILETVGVPKAAISEALKQGLGRECLCHPATGDEASWEI